MTLKGHSAHWSWEAVISSAGLSSQRNACFRQVGVIPAQEGREGCYVGSFSHGYLTQVVTAPYRDDSAPRDSSTAGTVTLSPSEQQQCDLQIDTTCQDTSEPLCLQHILVSAGDVFKITHYVNFHC